MRKEKLMFAGQVIVLLLLLSTFGLWFITTVQNKGIQGLVLGIPVVILVIIAVMLPILIRNYKGIKRNMPLADERSQKAAYKAGYFSYLISIYLLLAIGWFGDDWFERPSQAIGAGILGMAVIFLVSLVYLEARGRL